MDALVRLNGAAPLSYLQQQLHDVPVNQTQHGLAVHVGDEITRPQPRFLRRAPFFHALQPKHRDVNGCKPQFPPGVFPLGNVTGTTPRRAQATYPDHMVDSVDVTVPHVDADGAQGEAVLLARAVDDDGGPQAGDGQG